MNRCAKLIVFLSLFSAVFSESLLNLMDTELKRNMEIIGKPSKENGDSVYFLRYEVFDREEYSFSATDGSIMSPKRNDSHNRYLNVDLRMGDYRRDNSHILRESYEWSGSKYIELPLEGDDATRHAIWVATDNSQAKAQQKLLKVRANLAVKVEEEDTSDDFSKESPAKYEGEIYKLSIDTIAVQNLLREVSQVFKEYPELIDRQVRLSEEVVTRYIVNSEGTRIRESSYKILMAISAISKADDGMEFFLYHDFCASNLNELPGKDSLITEARNIAATLIAFKKAPLVEPYVGPAMLEPEAASVFFHEIFGHRLEGHRLKDIEQGQTFKKKVGESVLPKFISVEFDPTKKYFEKTALVGHYLYDDEGVSARPVTIVDHGVLKGFLMSRTPVEGFHNSNGHGRCSQGRDVVSRQSNLFVIAHETHTPDELRKMLVAECKKQGKEFGLLFKEVAGGFTIQATYAPQVFEVIPLLVYKVYIDNRPDELVRGVDIVGTPLTCFENIIAAGNDLGAFNGYCGAESGMIPVSAVSPTLLISKLEVQRKYREQNRPPILPAPETDKEE